MFVVVYHVVGMVARFAPAPSGFVVTPNVIQVAEAAGANVVLGRTMGFASRDTAPCSTRT